VTISALFALHKHAYREKKLEKIIFGLCMLATAKKCTRFDGVSNNKEKLNLKKL